MLDKKLIVPVSCPDFDVTIRSIRPVSLLECMAGTTGLEPATSAVTGQRSNQLSYVPKVVDQQLGLMSHRMSAFALLERRRSRLNLVILPHQISQPDDK